MAGPSKFALTASSCIPNSIPATGPISTRWSGRSRRSNSCLGGVSSCEPARCGVAGAPPSRIQRRGFLQFAIYRTDLESLFGGRFFNAQRSTSNVQRSMEAIGRCTLEVERWAFSSFRRVKGAWWPSRSSKPLSIRQPPGRGRFDSYPLRQFNFDFRLAIVDIFRARSSIENQNSKIEISRKEVNPCRASKFED